MNPDPIRQYRLTVGLQLGCVVICLLIIFPLAKVTSLTSEARLKMVIFVLLNLALSVLISLLPRLGWVPGPSMGQYQARGMIHYLFAINACWLLVLISLTGGPLQSPYTSFLLVLPVAAAVLGEQAGVGLNRRAIFSYFLSSFAVYTTALRYPDPIILTWEYIFGPVFEHDSGVFFLYEYKLYGYELYEMIHWGTTLISMFVALAAYVFPRVDTAPSSAVRDGIGGTVICA